MNDPRVQAMCMRPTHSNISIFIINQDYNELPRRTIRANGNINHIFKPNISESFKIYIQLQCLAI